MFLKNAQHGFRSRRYFLSALLDVYDNIMLMINNKATVDIIYLDFSKAFDRVYHGALMHKQRYLGITGRLGLWFFYFLKKQAALCKNTWCHQPTSSCSEWSGSGYCPWPFTILDYDY